MSVLPTPRLVSTETGWRFGSTVLDGLEGPYPIPTPTPDPPPNEEPPT